MARALSVVNIQLMRARALFRCCFPCCDLVFKAFSDRGSGGRVTALEDADLDLDHVGLACLGV
jgi:hypothetical protein